MDNAMLNPGIGDCVLLALGNADTIVSGVGTQGIVLGGSGYMVMQTGTPMGTGAGATVVQDNAAGNTIDLSNATIRLTAHARRCMAARRRSRVMRGCSHRARPATTRVASGPRSRTIGCAIGLST